MMQLTDRFSEAAVFALDLHRDQRRKMSDAPYAAHLLSVAALVMEHGGGEDEAIAAILHDAAEDQGGEPTLRLIAERFGQNVADMVAACSDTLVTPKPPWRERKELFLEHLATASASVRLIKAADKLDNCRSLLREYRRHGDAIWAQFRGGRDGTLWFQRAVLTALEQGGKNPLVEELARTVAEFERCVDG